MELTYGDASKTKVFPSIARIAPPRKDVCLVEFLIDESSPRNRRMLKAVRRELDFYLVELQDEAGAWVYAQYHCGTASNLYSPVHWGYFPKGKRERKRAAARRS
jgi:hypothetical protein